MFKNLVLFSVLFYLTSASYYRHLSNYWRSIEERYLSGLDNDDLFDGDALFEGTPCRGFTNCLRSSGVDFVEFGDHRCSNLTRLFKCYAKVKKDCSKKGLSGWQHIFVPNSDNIALPLPSVRRFNAECESKETLLSILQDLKRTTSALDTQCQSDDPMKKYFVTGMINRELVYDAPAELPPDQDDTPMRLTCRFFLSAINEGYFAYRIDKSGPGACYPSLLHRTCSALDVASANFIKHCRVLLGSSTQPLTASNPVAPVTPSFYPESCVDLMRSSTAPDLNALRTSNNRRFLGFIREDAVFPVRPKITFSPSDEAALPPQKCQLSELGWITLLANQFYKISGLVKKNGTQGYLVEVEVQLFREPLNSTLPTTPSGSSTGKVTVITVPQVQHSSQTGGLHDLAGHGTMRLRNIAGVGTLALIRLFNSRTNCALLRYTGLDRYHLRCRLPFDLVSRSFGLLVDGCETFVKNQDPKPQEREGDTLLQKLLEYDLTLVTDAIFDLEKDSGFWSPKRISGSSQITGQVAAASAASSASSSLRFCFLSAFQSFLFLSSVLVLLSSTF